VYEESAAAAWVATLTRSASVQRSFMQARSPWSSSNQGVFMNRLSPAKTIAAAALAFGALGVASAAHADGVYFSFGAPAYVEPAPVYVQPQPVYVDPPAQVYVPPPAPAPVYGYGHDNDLAWRRAEWRREQWRRQHWAHERWEREHRWHGDRDDD
jgi:hypothetical protein